jgi:DNA invertase Pin-like site-specific DNA recombinase
MSWSRAPIARERLDRAELLLREGASQKEVSTTTGISRGVLNKHFPELKWTSKQAGEFRAATRYVKVSI